MRTTVHVLWGVLLLALVIAGPIGSALGQEKTEAATRQYNAAVVLQNRGAYEQAAAEWAKFINTYKTDPRCDRAFHYLGFCYLKDNKLDLARQCFETVLKTYPNCNLLDATHYCLGTTLYNIAQSGKPEMYDAAAAAFETVISKHPQSAFVAQALFNRGECFYHRGKKKEAAEMYAQLLDKFPRDNLAVDAFYALGVSHEELGQADEAGKDYDLFLKKYPQNLLAAEVSVRRAALLAQAMMDRADAVYKIPERRGESVALYAAIAAKYPQAPIAAEALYMAAFTALGKGDFPTAIRHADVFLAAYVNNKLAADASYVAAESCLQLGQFAEAERRFGELLQKHPTHANAATWKIRRGLSLYPQKKYAETIALLQPVLAELRTPDALAEVHYLLGLCQAGLQKPSEAAASFQASLKEHPKYADADKVLYELAWALKQQDKETEAIAAFARLAAEHAQSPLAAEAQYCVGESAFKSGEFKNAVLAYRASMDKAGKTALGEKAAHKLGWSYFRLDDFANAQQTFNYQRATWPQGPLAADAAFMEGESLVKQKKFAEAIAAYEMVKNPAGKDFEPLTLLHAGQSAAQLKQWDKSLVLLSKCIERFADSPYLPEMLYEQGWAKQNLGKPDEAVALYQQVIAKTAREAAAQAQLRIGQIQFEQKNYAEAKNSFFKVSYGYSYPRWQAEAAYEAGRCFEALGKKADAVKQYREVTEKHPQSDKAPAAKQRIEALQK